MPRKNVHHAITDESDVTGLNLKVVQKFGDDKNTKKEFVKDIWKAFKESDGDDHAYDTVDYYDNETDAEDNLWLSVSIRSIFHT